VPLDLTITDRLVPALEEGLAAAGTDPASLSLIIKNAGSGVHGPFVEEKIDELHRRIRLNVDAPAAITRWGIEVFRSFRTAAGSAEEAHPGGQSGRVNRRGFSIFRRQRFTRIPPTICNIASVASFTPGPWMASYYAAKGWLLALGEALAEEVRNEGIRVVTCCPGPFESEFHGAAGIAAERLGRLPTAERIAGEIIRAIRRGRPVAPIGIGPRVWAVVGPRLPRSWSRRIVAAVQRRRFR
jgi:short-subunit dehydrogenase